MALTKKETKFVINELVFRRSYYLMGKERYGDTFKTEADKITAIIEKLKEEQR